VGHDGGGFAFRSLYRIIPELNVGIVLLTNTDNGEFIWFENPLLDIYLKEEKNKSINYKYFESDLTPSTKPNPEEIIGQYNLGSQLININAPAILVEIDRGFCSNIFLFEYHLSKKIKDLHVVALIGIFLKIESDK